MLYWAFVRNITGGSDGDSGGCDGQGIIGSGIGVGEGARTGRAAVTATAERDGATECTIGGGNGSGAGYPTFPPIFPPMGERGTATAAAVAAANSNDDGGRDIRESVVELLAA